MPQLNPICGATDCTVRLRSKTIGQIQACLQNIEGPLAEKLKSFLQYDAGNSWVSPAKERPFASTQAVVSLGRFALFALPAVPTVNQIRVYW